MPEPKERIKVICEVPCPYCAKLVIIKKKTKVRAPAQKADKEESYVAEKGQQTTLPGAQTPSPQ